MPTPTALTRLCLTPRYRGLSGPASFQGRLAAGLAARRIETSYNLQDPDCQAVLVVGGTRALAGLRRLRRRGVPIVQRLDGMNWIHRRRWTGLRHYLRAEYGNLLLAFIRRRLADQVVYQSEFARRWWVQARGPVAVPEHIIHNAVDLQAFSPDGPHDRPQDRSRLLLVEGNLMGGYDLGLEHAVELAGHLVPLSPRPLELMVAGNVPPDVRQRLDARSPVPVRWAGAVPGEKIPELDRSAHLLFSADLNPACPNAVIEALACGLPVTALDTGALSELVTPQAGRLAPYGGDPWRLDPPDLAGLAGAAAEVLEDQLSFRAAARAQAEAAFRLDVMVDRYVEVLKRSG